MCRWKLFQGSRISEEKIDILRGFWVKEASGLKMGLLRIIDFLKRLRDTDVLKGFGVESSEWDCLAERGLLGRKWGF